MQVPDGWIEHDGGPCPIKKPAATEVILRSGLRCFVANLFAGWNHGVAPHAQVIAYRPENPDAQ